MPDFESVMNDLTGELSSVLSNFDSSLKLILPNSNERAEAYPLDPILDEYVRVRFSSINGRLTEIGGKTSLNQDRMVCGIYTRLGEGEARPREIGDAIASGFQSKLVGDASCQEVVYRPIGRDPGSAFWRSEASVRFKWENSLS